MSGDQKSPMPMAFMCHFGTYKCVIRNRGRVFGSDAVPTKETGMRIHAEYLHRPSEMGSFIDPQAMDDFVLDLRERVARSFAGFVGRA